MPAESAASDLFMLSALHGMRLPVLQEQPKLTAAVTSWQESVLSTVSSTS